MPYSGGEFPPPSEEAPRKAEEKGEAPLGIKSRAGRMGTAHAEGEGGARSKKKGFPYPFSENEVRHCGMRFGCGGGGGSVPRSPLHPYVARRRLAESKGASSKGGGERRAHPQRRNSTKFQRSIPSKLHCLVEEFAVLFGRMDLPFVLYSVKGIFCTIELQVMSKSPLSRAGCAKPNFPAAA